LDFAAVQVFGDLRPSRKLKRESVKFTKYLLFQTLAQLFILLIFTFIGEYLVLEFDSSRTSCVNPSNEGYICSGKFYKINGEYDYIHYYAEYGPSRHFTFIFNLFFFMQVFNMLNMTRSRKRVYKFNKMTLKTLFVLVLTLAVQVIATQFLNFYLNVNENGLSIVQWSLCVGYAAVPVLLDILYCLVFRR
jgi:magnesium-transporting ATPase (P-type)